MNSDAEGPTFWGFGTSVGFGAGFGVFGKYVGDVVGKYAGSLGKYFGRGADDVVAPNRVKVTSWAEAGHTADLNSGRWVQVGEPTVWNYLKTGLWGGKVDITKQFPFITWRGSNVPFANYISDFVEQSQLMWPNGWEFIKGVLGQRRIK